MEQNKEAELRARAKEEYDKLKAQVDAARAAEAPSAPAVKAQPAPQAAPEPAAVADTATARTERPTIGSLINDISTQASTLVRGEIEHAQASLTGKVKNLGIGGVLLAAAGVVALYMLGLLFITLSLVLALWVPVWAGFAIMTAVLAVVAGIVALVGKKKLDASKKYQVGKGLNQDVSAIKEGLKK